MGTKKAHPTNECLNYTKVHPENEPACVINSTLSPSNSKIKIDPSFPLRTRDAAGCQAGRKIFGYELVLDLFECDKKIITSRVKLQVYVNKLCKLIKMKKYGETLLPYFGEKEEFTKGYSLVQLIETSSITGHFSDYWQTAYINIFSCRKYNHTLAQNFTREFFKAKQVNARLLIR